MFEPSKTSDNVLKGMPSVYGYGKVTMGSLRQDKRSVAQRGLDAIQRSLPFKSKNDIQYGQILCISSSWSETLLAEDK
jgi:hypothetical protein